VSFLVRICLSFSTISLLSLSACGGGGGTVGGLSSRGSFTLTSAEAEAFARVAEFLFVDAVVNGVPARFILDTGADAFVISEEFAARAELEIVSQAQVTTIAGSSTVDVARISEFSFANVVGVDIDAAVLPLTNLDGIIGLPFFEAVVLSVDYSSGRLVIRDPATFSLEENQSMFGGELFRVGSSLVLDGVIVDGVDIGSLRIDTGSSGGIRVDAARGQTLLDQASDILPVLSSATNGQVPGTAFIVSEFSRDPFFLENQFMIVQSAPLDIGLLGSLVLRQFFIVFDASRGTMVLRQERAFEYALVDASDLFTTNPFARAGSNLDVPAVFDSGLRVGIGSAL